MRSSLTTGLDTAKGLAVAWQVPLVGVNHMQAHALTPRLVFVLENLSEAPKPDFPFISLLVSGGHTLLVHSTGVVEHEILATTTDIAIGDAIDKIARSVLPPSFLETANEIMYGRLLERFVFPDGESDYEYVAPRSRQEEIARKETKWGWKLVPPLAETRSGSKSKSMEFTFSGLESAIRRICEAHPDMSIDERKDLAREGMRLAFEHLASRVGWALQNQSQQKANDSLVISGGVASNGFLKTMWVKKAKLGESIYRNNAKTTSCSLQSFLAARGFPDVKFFIPPIALCTDNAAMVAWTGMEMFEAGWETELKCRALRKWSIDPKGEDGGILGVDCWRRR